MIQLLNYTNLNNCLSRKIKINDIILRGIFHKISKKKLKLKELN